MEANNRDFHFSRDATEEGSLVLLYSRPFSPDPVIQIPRWARSGAVEDVQVDKKMGFNFHFFFSFFYLIFLSFCVDSFPSFYSFFRFRKKSSTVSSPTPVITETTKKIGDGIGLLLQQEFNFPVQLGMKKNSERRVTLDFKGGYREVRKAMRDFEEFYKLIQTLVLDVDPSFFHYRVPSCIYSVYARTNIYNFFFRVTFKQGDFAILNAA